MGRRPNEEIEKLLTEFCSKPEPMYSVDTEDMPLSKMRRIVFSINNVWAVTRPQFEHVKASLRKDKETGQHTIYLSKQQ